MNEWEYPYIIGLMTTLLLIAAWSHEEYDFLVAMVLTFIVWFTRKR